MLGGFVSLSSGEVVARAVAFVATAYLARVLGPEGFGILGIATALCGYAALAVRAGFDDVGARDVARRPERAAEIAAGATLVRLGLATVALAAIALVAALLPKPPVVRLVVVLTGLSFFSLALETGWVYKGLGRTVHVGVALVVGQIVYVALVLLSVRSPNHVARAPLAQVLGELVTAAILLVPLLRRGRARPDLREGLAILRASGFVTVTRVLRTLIYTFDVVLIGLWLGEHDVGLYTAAYRLCFLLLAIAGSLHVAYLPLFARAHDRDEQRRLAARALELSAVVSFPLVVGGGMIAERLLDAIFGFGYVDGAAALRLLLVSVGLIFLHGTNHNLLLVLGRTREEMRVVGVAAVANVVLNLVAIPRWGIVGAAVTTVVSEALVLVLGLFLLTRLGARPPFRPLLRAAVAAGGMAAALALLNRDVPVVLSVAVGAVVYVGALVALRGIPAEFTAALARPRPPAG